MRSRSTFRILAVLSAGLLTAALSGGEATAFTSTSSGYVCVDSEEVSSATSFPPMFQWDDIQLVPSNTFFGGTDGTALVGMNFNINVMNNLNSVLGVHDDGYVMIGFNQLFGFLANSAIPSAALPNAAIYGFWDDLNSWANVNNCRFIGIGQTIGARRYVVQWAGITHAQGAGVANVSFQITFFEAGGGTSVLIQYLTMTGTNGGGQSATVGLENINGNGALQYLFNGAPAANNLYNGLAIGFHPTGITPPWTVQPGVPIPLPPPVGGTVDPNAPPDPGKGARHSRRCGADAGAGEAGAASLAAMVALLALAFLRRTAP